ncbi:hypothetical protein G647_09068 [Cladophialophora carrionii CBS 160.54]|uniref:Uncharacterized protein n=1 Tax=Cladophialophora carrionii CBS 160.54 TaxID=1279043 RepID=V9D196_9EURO|nr:uncharacterized protein G647_09068 [Cladophialophora carrionii CBS 160.54]ETI20053.1 hypothetical protein G647_09068 [Cladophialophora carrionii CBS 160.54]
MGRDKNRKHRPRASSVTPQKVDSRTDYVDLTKTDPWAHQARLAKRAQSVGPASISKPTLLSPAFSGEKTTGNKSTPRSGTVIGVPHDPNIDPRLVYQRVAAFKNNAQRHPSSFSTVMLDEEEEEATGKSDDTIRDETPTPGQKEGRDKKKKRSKHKDKENQEDVAKTRVTRKTHMQVEEDMRKEKKKKVKKEMEQQTARAIEGMQAAAADRSRKRKRDEDGAEAFKRRVEVEANAVKRLRESLPVFRLERVINALERDEGSQPTEMAVLLTAARETIIDLARAQLLQMEQMSNVVEKEMLNIVRAQRARLDELEGRKNATVLAPAPAIAATTKPMGTEAEAFNDTSSAGSDDSSDDLDVEVIEMPKRFAGRGGATKAPNTLGHCSTQ